MGITNESVFEYCYYEYFVVDAHFDSLLNKMMMKKIKKYRELVVAIRTSYYDPIPYPWLFFPGQWFRNQLMSEEQSRECSAATSALLCFLLQMLYDDEPGVEDVSCGLSLKKKLGLMVVSPISFSLQFCMLSGVLKSISSWQLVKSQRPPQKASSTHPLWLSSRGEEKEEHHF